MSANRLEMGGGAFRHLEASFWVALWWVNGDPSHGQGLYTKLAGVWVCLWE